MVSDMIRIYFVISTDTRFALWSRRRSNRMAINADTNWLTALQDRLKLVEGPICLVLKGNAYRVINEYRLCHFSIATGLLAANEARERAYLKAQ